MAHHDSTPASVLAAPKLKPLVVWPMGGANRLERRRGFASFEDMKAARERTNLRPFVGDVRRDLVDVSDRTRRRRRASAKQA